MILMMISLPDDVDPNSLRINRVVEGKVRSLGSVPVSFTKLQLKIAEETEEFLDAVLHVTWNNLVKAIRGEKV